MKNIALIIKSLVVIGLTVMVGSAVQADCVGDKQKHQCALADGGSYQLERHGRTTRVSGITGEGKTWSRVTRKQGNAIVVIGEDPDGTSFRSRSVTVGDRTTTTVTPSFGKPYQITCRGDDCVERLTK
ncbi:hypothetical protein [Halocynthiibacter namhaensis]|uniref:hypothetical protein n=1 Tax=Halocynthiibacter namhaensis TaxID=1290553 RepID=UPI000578F355|nr:hypothetical protein [Halocynthiibacter namhaensis]